VRQHEGDVARIAQQGDRRRDVGNRPSLLCTAQQEAGGIALKLDRRGIG
jgi:hypothetical protein